MASFKTRKVRIVCVSDTHNSTVKLPPGDILIHAGDLTNQGSFSELERTVRWLEAAPFEAKIVVAGNHDITLDEPFYSAHHSSFHNSSPQDSQACLSLLKSSPSITYLHHTSTTISLSSPHVSLKVFGSPYSPRCGLWAFQYDAPASPSVYSEFTNLWEDVPLDSDVVITHTPPRLHCDEGSKRRAEGCEALRRMLWRVRPRLAVCGHVHAARGAERITWDLNSRNAAYSESKALRWEDPATGNNKLSLLDLTGKKGATALDNDGSHPRHPVTPSRQTMSLDGNVDSTPQKPSVKDAEAKACSSTVGLGGDPVTSSRCDVEAMRGRMGRRETAVVNAAIVRTNYPHTGGKVVGKAIVVDLYLPVRED